MGALLQLVEYSVWSSNSISFQVPSLRKAGRLLRFSLSLVDLSPTTTVGPAPNCRVAFAQTPSLQFLIPYSVRWPSLPAAIFHHHCPSSRCSRQECEWP